MATITINEFLKLLRNKSITNETNITAKIKSKTTELTAAFCTDFGLNYEKFGELPGFRYDGMPFILKHPLWRDDSNIPNNILSSAKANAGENVKMVDSFNIDSRPAWTYEKKVRVNN